MKRKLLIQACVKFVAGLLLGGCLLFLPEQSPSGRAGF